MNPNRSQMEKVIEILQNMNSGVICIPDNASQDHIAAATGLYLGLTSAGKNVTLAASGGITSDLIASEKFQSELSTSGDNLVISFPYTEGSIDKVDYYIQNDKFNIVVSPRQGTGPIDAKSVSYSTAGGGVDFVVVIGASSLRALGALHAENQDLFKQVKIVNVDRSLTNAYFGQANLVNRNVSSLSELVLTLLSSMNIEIDKETATNLYAGILSATKTFTTPNTNASTFEASAFLLKAGAKKSLQSSDSGSSPQAGQASRYGGQKKSFERQGAKPMNSVERAPAMPSLEGVEGADDEEENDDSWLKPKIFKGGTGESGS
jgi:hypothetical protein